MILKYFVSFYFVLKHYSAFIINLLYWYFSYQFLYVLLIRFESFRNFCAIYILFVIITFVIFIRSTLPRFYWIIQIYFLFKKKTRLIETLPFHLCSTVDTYRIGVCICMWLNCGCFKQLFFIFCICMFNCW